LEESESLLLARYLVEDNDEKIVLFNPGAQSNLACVKSIFRTLLGTFVLLDVFLLL
jgi:hypothetical protein